MVNLAQIHNQNLANIVYRGSSHMLHFLRQAATQGKATEGLPSHLHCVPVSVHLYKSSPRIKIRLIRLRLSLCTRSCAAISSFASSVTNQMVLFEPIKP